MKILSLGLDKSILDKNSPLAKRTVEYGNLVEKYTVIVPSREDAEIVLSEQANAIGVGSKNKIVVLLKIYNKAKNLLVKERYDIITVQDQYYLALIGWILAKKFNIGLEIQIHGFEKYFGLRKMVAKYVIPRANTIRAVSQRLKKQLVDEFSVKEEKITVVPIYSGIRNQESGIRNYKNKDKFIFLTVGRLVPVKNIKMQIKTIANIVKQYPNIELWIAGDGPEMRNLKLEIRNLWLEENVKLLGWQDDLEKFYRQADVFLLTSNYEGWGMAVIEAASYGLPIIMTDVGCAGEVIKNDESSIVIPVGNQKALEQAIIRLVEDKKLREKLGENALQAVKKLLTKKETLNLYKKSWHIAIKTNS